MSAAFVNQMKRRVKVILGPSFVSDSLLSSHKSKRITWRNAQKNCILNN